MFGERLSPTGIDQVRRRYQTTAIWKAARLAAVGLGLVVHPRIKQKNKEAI
jgi:hypothetical protein